MPLCHSSSRTQIMWPIIIQAPTKNLTVSTADIDVLTALVVDVDHIIYRYVQNKCSIMIT